MDEVQLIIDGKDRSDENTFLGTIGEIQEFG